MKNYGRLQGSQGPKGHFQTNLPLILIFTDKPVGQFDVQVVENTFIDDSK